MLGQSEKGEPLGRMHEAGPNMASLTNSDTTSRKDGGSDRRPVGTSVRTHPGAVETGWKRVSVVTDHGWLLVPGGLPKVTLPKYLAESRWSRCAAIKDTSKVEVPVSGWSWDQQQRFANAPGAHCFVAGHEYAHGGVSLQECLVPMLAFTASVAPSGLIARVSDIQWIHQRCRVIVAPVIAGLFADLRTKPNVASSSITEPKPRTLRAKRLCWLPTTHSKGPRSAWSLLMHQVMLFARKPPLLEVIDKMKELDHLDQLAASAFDGYLVRKDLVRRYSRQYPVPTYVVEFLLGRYCATVKQEEIDEGLKIVERQLQDRTVRTSEQELFKARAREKGSVKLIDIVKARLDAKTDSFLVELPSLGIKDIRIADAIVHEHERMLTDGFYAEVTLTYDAAIAEEKHGRPFAIESLRAIQLSKSDVLSTLKKGRGQFTTAEWKDFLLRSVGLEPAAMTERAKMVVLLRMVPFVERNYNLVELGPRGTGKSHLYQQISPYSHLISGGKATVAKMFVNMSNGQRGLVCLYDVVCFDEVSGISFDQKAA